MTRRILIAALAIAAAAPAFGAEPKDLAALFPAGTLAYAEIGRPADTSDAIAAFVKGTLLAESLPFGHDRRDRMPPPGTLGSLKKAGSWSLLASPEMLAECKRLRGVAAAVTGFDAKTGRPSVAVAFVLGDSHLAGLLVRQYLLTSPNIRRVGKIEGIAVYQNRGLTGAPLDENGKPLPIDDPTPAQGTSEATYFSAPGLFVVGSDVAAVRDVYRRFAGTEAAASFAASPVLKPHAEAREKPGVFFCADMAGIEAQVNAAKKVSPAEWLKAPALAYTRFLLDPKQVDRFAGSLQLQPDGWTLTARAEIKAGGNCPLLALLTGGVATSADLRGGPADATASFIVAFPVKEQRAKAISDAADAVGRARGQAGALPGELLAEAEKAGFKLAGEWLPLVRAASVTLPKESTDPKAKPAHPLVVLTLDDEAAAAGWLAILPKVSQVFSGAEKVAEPSSETIQTVKVWGLVHGFTPVHYASAGARLIVGRDRDAVAKAAMSVANPWPKTEGPSAALGAVAFAKVWEVTPHGLPFQTRYIEEEPKGNPPVPESSEPRAIVSRAWNAALAAMPPVLVHATGDGRTLTFRLSHNAPKKTLAKWLEAFWENVESAPDLNPGQEPGSELRERGQATRDVLESK